MLDSTIAAPPLASAKGPGSTTETSKLSAREDRRLSKGKPGLPTIHNLGRGCPIWLDDDFRDLVGDTLLLNSIFQEPVVRTSAYKTSATLNLLLWAR
jgi:hypothetical protein